MAGVTQVRSQTDLGNLEAQYLADGAAEFAKKQLVDAIANWRVPPASGTVDIDGRSVPWTLTDTGWAKAAWGLLYPPLLAGATILLYDGEGFDAEMHDETESTAMMAVQGPQALQHAQPLFPAARPASEPSSPTRRAAPFAVAW